MPEFEEFTLATAHAVEILPDFGAPSESAPAEDAQLLQATQLQAEFDRGFAAGRDARARETEDAQAALTLEIARNFRDLSFTYEEARAHVTLAMAPLLAAMVEKVLPRLASRNSDSILRDQLAELVASSPPSPLTIAVAPGTEAQAAALLPPDVSVPCTIASDDSLAAGQVSLRMGASEVLLDPGSVMARIEEAVSGLLDDARVQLRDARGARP